MKFNLDINELGDLLETLANLPEAKIKDGKAAIRHLVLAAYFAMEITADPTDDAKVKALGEKYADMTDADFVEPAA